MNKRALLITLLIFSMVTILTAATPAKTTLARLEIKNKTGEVAKVRLRGRGNFYFLTVDPYTTKIFTVEREVYRFTTYACNRRRGGRLDLTTNKRLVIRHCEKPNVALLTIKNKTDQKVMLSLSRGSDFHFLTVDPFITKNFTIAPKQYFQTTFSCGKSASGYLDMSSDVRLVFTGCGGAAPNKGEPTQEKVHLDDSPGETIWWRYFNWE